MLALGLLLSYKSSKPTHFAFSSHHNFPLAVFIRERSDTETVYLMIKPCMCITPDFIALPLCYVFNLSLVFGIFDIAFDFIS